MTETIEAGLDYTVELEAYTGPLDLLLYLIRQHEIDIFDIPIALITEQFLVLLETMKELDLDFAGEFLVLAATLLEIKSNLMLPQPEAEDGAGEDPRLELVRQLLEYKKYKELGAALDRRREAFARRAPRGFDEIPPPRVEGGRYFEDVTVWDLFRAFQELARDTLLAVPRLTFAHDKPVRAYMAQIETAFAAAPRLSFRALFAGGWDRAVIIGLFLAVLELVRLGRLRCEQQDFGDLTLEWVA